MNNSGAATGSISLTIDAWGIDAADKQSGFPSKNTPPHAVALVADAQWPSSSCYSSVCDAVEIFDAENPTISLSGYHQKLDLQLLLNTCASFRLIIRIILSCKPSAQKSVHRCHKTCTWDLGIWCNRWPMASASASRKDD